jgi:hypothetical protein
MDCRKGISTLPVLTLRIAPSTASNAFAERQEFRAPRGRK